MDRRFQAYNERVAAIDLKSRINHHNFVQPQQYQIAVPLCDLRDRPNGKRQRQLLYGANVDVFEEVEGWAFVRQQSDGYVGYLKTEALGNQQPPTHFVTSVLTHCYLEANFKSPDVKTILYPEQKLRPLIMQMNILKLSPQSLGPLVCQKKSQIYSFGHCFRSLISSYS